MAEGELQKQPDNRDSDNQDSLVPVKQVPEEQQVAIRESVQAALTAFSFSIIQSRSFRGPLPPPELFAGYKEVMDDAPERIFKLTEGEAAHRHDLEKRGQNRATAITLAALAVVAIAAVWGGQLAASIIGVVLGGGALATLALTFMQSGKMYEPRRRQPSGADSQDPKLPPVSDDNSREISN